MSSINDNHVNIYSDNNHTYNGYTGDEMRLMLFKMHDDNINGLFYNLIMSYCCAVYSISSNPYYYNNDNHNDYNKERMQVLHLMHMLADKVNNHTINELIMLMEKTNMNPLTPALNMTAELNKIGINLDYMNDKLLLDLTDNSKLSNVIMDYIGTVMRIHHLDAYKLSANLDKLEGNPALINKMQALILTTLPESEEAKESIVNSELYDDIDDNELAQAKTDELTAILQMSDNLVQKLTGLTPDNSAGLTVHDTNAYNLVRNLLASTICLSADDMNASQIIMMKTQQNLSKLFNEPDKVDAGYNAFIDSFINLMNRGITINDDACKDLLKSYALTSELDGDLPDMPDFDE